MLFDTQKIIDALAEQGIRAAVCPECGRVREVAENLLVPHEHKGKPCGGSGAFVVSVEDPDFAEVTKGVTLEMPPPFADPPTTDSISDEEAEEDDEDHPVRFLIGAEAEAHQHLTACFAALECEEGGCEHTKDSQHLESPALAPFDGCQVCVVREVQSVMWEWAEKAETEAVARYLESRAHHPAIDQRSSASLHYLARMLRQGEHHVHDRADEG